MGIFKERPEDALKYADSVVNNVVSKVDSIFVIGESYDQKDINLKFSDARLVLCSGEWPEIVSCSQKIKLRNGHRRLILFSDSNEIFLEIEFSVCKNI